MKHNAASLHKEYLIIRHAIYIYDNNQMFLILHLNTFLLKLSSTSNRRY